MTRVAVLGLGLIGGSAALALGARGYDASPEARARARARGIHAFGTLAEALDGAEIPLTAVPTAATPQLLRDVASHFAFDPTPGPPLGPESITPEVEMRIARPDPYKIRF